MIAEGWGIFEEAVSAAGEGDLPVTAITEGNDNTTSNTTTTDECSAIPNTPTPSLVKKEGGTGTEEDPLLIRIKGKIKYSYPQCSTIVTSKNGCDAHIRATHTGKTLRCAYCSFSTYNMDSLNRHLSEHN